jgi:pimeloyl-ACP methyl ester carboxylesterase
MVSADLNWYRAFEPLASAGYRVVALDHRGHGRGLRTHAPFGLADCAADAAALVAELGAGPALAVGYSMGGPIALLMAHDHPEAVRGLVLGATALRWRDPHMRRGWRLMGLTRLALGLFPRGAWRAGLRRIGLPDSPATTWLAAELTRGSSVDLAEAGRELGRFDASPWIGSLAAPAAVIVTGEATPCRRTGSANWPGRYARPLGRSRARTSPCPRTRTSSTGRCSRRSRRWSPRAPSARPAPVATEHLLHPPVPAAVPERRPEPLQRRGRLDGQPRPLGRQYERVEESRGRQVRDREAAAHEVAVLSELRSSRSSAARVFSRPTFAPVSSPTR